MFSKLEQSHTNLDKTSYMTKRTKEATKSIETDAWYVIYRYLAIFDLYSLCHTSKQIQDIITTDLISREDFIFVFDATKTWTFYNVSRKDGCVANFFYCNVGAKIERIRETGIVGTNEHKRYLVELLPTLCIRCSVEVFDDCISIPTIEETLTTNTNFARETFLNAQKAGNVSIMKRILKVPNINIQIYDADELFKHPASVAEVIWELYRTHPHFDDYQEMLFERQCDESTYGLQELLDDPRLDLNSVKHNIGKYLRYAPVDVVRFIVTETTLCAGKSYERIFTKIHKEFGDEALYVLLDLDLLDIYKREYGYRQNLMDFLCSNCNMESVATLLDKRPDIMIEHDTGSAIKALCACVTEQSRECKEELTAHLLGFHEYSNELLLEAVQVAIASKNYEIGEVILHELSI